MPEWFNIKKNSTADEPAEVMIYDQIGERTDWETGKKVGIGAKKFSDDLAALDAKTINLRINSVGGEVFEGFAIANAIKAHPATVNIKIDALAASIAAVIAMSGDTVCIAKNGYLMIHDPLMACFGNSEDLRKNADQLDQLANTIGQTFADKSGKSIEDVRAKMRDETWFDSKSAMEFGLVDSIDGDDDADEDDDKELNKVTAIHAVARFKKAPARLRKFAASVSVQKPPVKEQSPMPLKPITRDGKTFVSIAGVEHEIDAIPTPVPENKIDVEKIKNEAAAKAVADERAYRAMFGTVVASAGLTGKAADEFEKTFYGRAEADLKFLAQHAIGTRAKPLGEGSGEPEQKEKTDVQKAEDAAGNRFDESPEVRSMYGTNLRDPASNEYKSAHGRHVAAARSRFLNSQKKEKPAE